MTFQHRCSRTREISWAYRFRLLCSVAVRLGVVACSVSLSSLANGASSSEEELAQLEQRGEYLAAAGNCVSCHTNGDDKLFSGGLAFETPFGTIYSTNITPDSETGIGRWSLEDFSKAVRLGEAPDGKHYYPVFPYTAFAKINDEDVAALYAYFKTIPPVRSTAPENDLGFPYSQRWALGSWKWMYHDASPFEPQGSQSEEWNRGAYLVEGLGHCSMCHTPRNFLGANDVDLAMTGGNYMTRVEGKLSAWSAPNLTSADAGLALWTVEDITDYLKLGVSHRAGVFGPMNEVVLNSTRHLSEEDVRAMAVYLKSLPANAQDSGEPATADVMRAGSVQYDIHCGSCHLPTGEGSPEQGPPLIGSPVVLDADPASLINITLYGAQTPHVSPSEEWAARTWIRMEPFENLLDDEQVAAVLSFIRGTWGHEAGAVTPEQVAAQR
ncbi:MAG: cytochrome c [Pseudohongiellaceae bacterium]